MIYYPLIQQCFYLLLLSLVRLNSHLILSRLNLPCIALFYRVKIQHGFSLGYFQTGHFLVLYFLCLEIYSNDIYKTLGGVYRILLKIQFFRKGPLYFRMFFPLCFHYPLLCNSQILNYNQRIF